MTLSLPTAILFYIVRLFLLYIVIETAVRRGINSSIIGQILAKNEQNAKKSFFDKDLDND